jgi:hypothetical protein
MPFYRPVHTGPLAEMVSYFFAAALADSDLRNAFDISLSREQIRDRSRLSSFDLLKLPSSYRSTAMLMGDGHTTDRSDDCIDSSD